MSEKTLVNNLGENHYLGNYLRLDWWNYLIMVGIAASGIAAFVNTYDLLVGMDNEIAHCQNNDLLQSKLHIRWVVLLLFSVLLMLAGILLAWTFKTEINQRKFLIVSLILTGILGTIYAIIVKFKNVTGGFKMVTSWIVFLVFLVYGWYLSRKLNV